MIEGILIGFLIYSFILTCVLLYKEQSSYFIIEWIDVIASGIFAWIIFLFFEILKLFIKKFNIEMKRREKQHRPISYAKAKKIIFKAIRIYKKYCPDGEENIFIADKTPYRYQDFYRKDIVNLKELKMNRARYEHFNRKADRLFRNQYDLAVEIIEDIGILLTDENFHLYADEELDVDRYKMLKYKIYVL